MFSHEIRDMKSECWHSQWRAAGDNGAGRPRFYIWTSQDEMLTLATTGVLDIPENQLPAELIAQRDVEKAAELLEA